MKTSTGIARNALIIVLTFILILIAQLSYAQTSKQMVRIAKIEVDPAQLKNYKAALKESVETTIRTEPGVLSYYAVAEKTHPTHIIIVENLCQC